MIPFLVLNVADLHTQEVYNDPFPCVKYCRPLYSGNLMIPFLVLNVADLAQKVYNDPFSCLKWCRPPYSGSL